MTQAYNQMHAGPNNTHTGQSKELSILVHIICWLVLIKASNTNILNGVQWRVGVTQAVAAALELQMYETVLNKAFVIESTRVESGKIIDN